MVLLLAQKLLTKQREISVSKRNSAAASVTTVLHFYILHVAANVSSVYRQRTTHCFSQFSGIFCQNSKTNLQSPTSFTIVRNASYVSQTTVFEPLEILLSVTLQRVVHVFRNVKRILGESEKHRAEINSCDPPLLQSRHLLLPSRWRTSRSVYRLTPTSHHVLLNSLFLSSSGKLDVDLTPHGSSQKERASNVH